jgi:hypothetical protein
MERRWLHQRRQGDGSLSESKRFRSARSLKGDDGRLKLAAAGANNLIFDTFRTIG